MTIKEPQMSWSFACVSRSFVSERLERRDVQRGGHGIILIIVVIKMTWKCK